VARVRALVGNRDVVNLKTEYQFDRVPASRRAIYAICRKYAAEWGYEYRPGEYHASGNPAFKRNHKRGYRSGPVLFRVRRSTSS
jgi:hypothetical protein